jgi:hypothetical protein
MPDEKRITYKLRCTCPMCQKTRFVTLPEGQTPKEMCSGRLMRVETQWYADAQVTSPRY